MNNIGDCFLRGLHRFYVNHYGTRQKHITREIDPDNASNLIY